VTSTITGMTATGRGDVWVAAQAGRGWSHPLVGPDEAWIQPPEHDVLLHRHAGRWTRVPVRVTHEAITHMTADGASDIWAIAGESTLVHWNGRRWSVVPTAGWRSGPILGGVAALSPTDAWLAGAGFTTHGSYALIEHWDGIRWRRVPAPTIGGRTQLSAIAAASADDVWAFGAYESDSAGGVHATSGVVVEHWDGRNWRLVPQPVYHRTKRSFRIADAVMISPADGWAVGSDRGTRTLALHWDGHRWRSVADAGCCELLAVARGTASDSWSAGYTAPRRTGAFQSRVEHWAGLTRKQIPAPSVGTTFIVAVSVLPDGVVYLAGTGANASDTTYPVLERLTPPRE
jgi:hypothetical protein